MELVSLNDYVLNIRGMTTSELCEAYPKHFKMPVWNGDKEEMVKKMLAIDAIKWRIVGEYAKFLNKGLSIEMFIPCDSKGIPVEKPDVTCLKEGNPMCSCGEEQASDCREYKRDWRRANEKIVFEGFEKFEYGENGSYTIEINQRQIFYYKSIPNYYTWNDGFNKIKDLTGLELTIKPNHTIHFN